MTNIGKVGFIADGNMEITGEYNLNEENDTIIGSIKNHEYTTYSSDIDMVKREMMNIFGIEDDAVILVKKTRRTNTIMTFDGLGIENAFVSTPYIVADGFKKIPTPEEVPTPDGSVAVAVTTFNEVAIVPVVRIKNGETRLTIITYNKVDKES